MSENRRVVERYMDGFRANDHELILSCLTDDVEGEGFVSPPTIVVTRMLEDGDVVIAEGSVHTRRSDGTELNLAMCDVFDMRGGKIRRLTSYLMPKA